MNATLDTLDAHTTRSDFYTRTVQGIASAADRWLLGFTARFVFAASLLVYYIASALTKPGEGLLGIFTPDAGAFAQIVPSIAEHYVYDTAAIPVFPWHLIVSAGTIAEFVLPVLIVLGCFTRISALGMMLFVLVQTYVDVAYHATELGGIFNRDPAELLDQRLFWLFPLLYLACKGAGLISLDRVFSKRWSGREALRTQAAHASTA